MPIRRRQLQERLKTSEATYAGASKVLAMLDAQGLENVRMRHSVAAKRAAAEKEMQSVKRDLAVLDGSTSQETLDMQQSPVLDRIFQNLQYSSKDDVDMVSKTEKILDILKSRVMIPNDQIERGILITVEFCLNDFVSPIVRTSGYRLLRYLITQRQHVNYLASVSGDIYIIRTLAREGEESNVEREEAIRLVHSLVYMSKSPSFVLPLSVIRGIVAIADSGDDLLRLPCLEFLAELAVLDTEVFVDSGGLRPLLQGVLEEDLEYLALFVSGNVLPVVLDRPLQRQFLQLGVDVESLLAPLTGGGLGFSKSTIAVASRAVASLMRTWPGFLYLTYNDSRSLKSIIDSLKCSDASTQEALVDLFMNLFGVVSDSVGDAFLKGDRMAFIKSLWVPGDVRRPIFLRPFLTLVLYTTFSYGLLDALSHVIVKSWVANDVSKSLSATTRKAFLLLSDLLLLAKELLPLSSGVQNESLTTLLSVAFSRLDLRNGDKLDQIFASTSTLFDLYAFHQHRTNQWVVPFDNTLTDRGFNPHHTSASHANGRTSSSASLPSSAFDKQSSFKNMSTVDNTAIQPHVDESFFTFGHANPGKKDILLKEPLKNSSLLQQHNSMSSMLALDGHQVRSLIVETHVLSSKEFLKWDWDKISLIVGGALLKPSRLDEAMHGSKFVKKLLNFFAPRKFRYSNLRRSTAYAKFTEVGIQLFTCLLKTQDGAQYLCESNLMSQLQETLLELTGVDISMHRRHHHHHHHLNHQHYQNSTDNAAPLFTLSRNRIAHTMSHGYFALLGVLCKEPLGLRIMQYHRLFTLLHKICAQGNREDVIAEVLKNIQCHYSNPSRQLLLRCLSCREASIRMLGLKKITSITSEVESSWSVEALMDLLYDPNASVAQAALDTVFRLSQRDKRVLKTLVASQPILSHLCAKNPSLIYLFLSDQDGCDLLLRSGILERELESWFKSKNLLYVLDLELSIARASSVVPVNAQQSASVLSKRPVQPVPELAISGFPAHFLGALVQTPLGYTVLHESGRILHLADFLKVHQTESEDTSVLLYLKSVLWAFGHIGAHTYGLQLLEHDDIIETIVDIAEVSPVFSIRGTALNALSLIASTVEGIQILEELGWVGITRSLNQPIGLCIPSDIGGILGDWGQPILHPDAVVDPFSLIKFSDTKPQEIENAWLLTSLSGIQATFLNGDYTREAKSASHVKPNTPVRRKFQVLPEPEDPVMAQVIDTFAKLASHILTNQASKTLLRARKKNASVFSSPELYFRILDMMGRLNFRLSARRFIFDCLELPLNSNSIEAISQAGQMLLRQSHVAAAPDLSQAPATPPPSSPVARPVRKERDAPLHVQIGFSL